MVVWLVIRREQFDWEVLGVFSTEEKAMDACTQYNDGYGPLNLDERLSDEPMEWQGFVYPNVEYM